MAAELEQVVNLLREIRDLLAAQQPTPPALGLDMPEGTTVVTGD